jgi:uncharacterized OsmC-like protein
MSTSTDLKTILADTESAIAANPSLAAVRVTANCELVGTHEVNARLNDRVIKSDQPPMLGGDGCGPNPVEIALAALGSCQAQTYRFWSEKLGIRIDDLTLEIQGDVDVHGIFGLRDGVRPGFGDVRVTVHISGPDTPERYEELRRAVDDHCPVLDIFANPVPVMTAMSAR